MDNTNQAKPIFVARAVSTVEMLNLINDKMDYIIALIQKPEQKAEQKR